MTTAVKELLNVIEGLPEKDQLALDRALARRLEREWMAEAEVATAAARKRHISQEAIDRAIERRRYGR